MLAPLMLAVPAVTLANHVCEHLFAWHWSRRVLVVDSSPGATPRLTPGAAAGPA
jgi:hypothetical protein